MGNCFRMASSMEWGGEEWGSLTSKNRRKATSSSCKVFDEGHELISTWNIQNEKLLDALRLRTSADANGKVKIKISKRELEVLLGGIEKQKMKKKKEGQVRAEQVLVRLRNKRDHNRPWSPVLESIPEVNSEY